MEETAPLKVFRQCKNCKSRKNPDVQCPFAATQGDYCARHHKNPNPFTKRSTAAGPVAAAAADRLRQFWLRASPLLRFRQQGPAVNAPDLAKNDTELYSMDPITQIPPVYRFSFADSRRALWLFDIRTLTHSMATGYPQQNPYTREQLPASAMTALHARLDWLRARKFHIQHMPPDLTALTPAQLWSQRVLDVFLKMESLGYYLSCDWFHDMSRAPHMRFYKYLFDLWAYRLNLTRAEQEAVVPGHMSPGPRRLFKILAEDLYERDRSWWARTTLDLMESFTTRAADREHRKLGVTYVLMALVQVSPAAAEALPWAAAAVDTD